MNYWQKQIREAIERNRMTITQFAEYMGISRVHLYNFMDRRIYSKKLLFRMCDALDLDVVEMVMFDLQEEIKCRKERKKNSHSNTRLLIT